MGIIAEEAIRIRADTTGFRESIQRSFSGVTEGAQQQMRGMNETLGQTRERFASAGTAGSTAMRDVHGRVVETTRGVTGLGTAGEEAGRKTSSGFRSSGSSAAAYGGALGGVGRAAFGVAAAVGGFAIFKSVFISPIASAGQFQQSLNILQATSHATNAQISQMSALSIKLGADIHLPTTSANDAATAMLELAKGGLSAKNTMQAVHATLLLSTAAQVDNATAAQMVVQALNAFQLPGSSAKKVVDDFAGAAVASTASMSDIAYAMQQASSGFHALRIPVGEATTAMAMMSNAGIMGGTAGAALNVALVRLANPTKKAAAELQMMNVHAFTAQGNFVGMSNFAGQFQRGLSGLTKQQQLQAVATIFGTRGMKAALDVFGQGSAAFNDLQKKVERAGQAQQLANAATKGFSGSLSALRSTVETIQLQIGLKLLPILTQLVRWFTAELPAIMTVAGNVFGAVSSYVQGFADIIQQHMSQIQTVLSDVGSAFDAFGQVLSFIAGPADTFRQALQGAGGVLAILLPAIMAVSVAMGILNLVMAANPFVLIAIAIAALVFALVELYQRSATARRIMDEAWSGIKAGAQAAMSFITNTVIPAAQRAWEQFGPTVMRILSDLASGIRTVITTIASIIAGTISQIRQNWDSIWSVFSPIVRMVFEVVKTSIQTTLKVIQDVIRLVMDLIRGNWGDAWHQLGNIVRDVLSGLVSMIGSVLHGLATTAGALALLIAKGIAAGIKRVVEFLVGLAGELVTALGKDISQAATQAGQLAISIGQHIVTGIVSGLSNLVGAVGGAIHSGISSAVGFAGGVLHGSGPFQFTKHAIAKPMITGITEGLLEGGPAVSGALLDTLHKVRDAAVTETKKSAPAVASAFRSWVTEAKKQFDAGAAEMMTDAKANLAKGLAEIQAWKARLTTPELALRVLQAKQAADSVHDQVTLANAALAGLQANQNEVWAKMLATQAANTAKMIAQQQKAMESLQQTSIQAHDASLLAGLTFQGSAATAGADPLAANLLAAQKNFDAIKKQHDAGLADDAAFVAAASRLNDAQTKAAGDANATQLLNDYNAWQTALAGEAAAGKAITDQQAADIKAQQDQQAADVAAQEAQQDQFHKDRLAAQDAADKANLQLQIYNMTNQAAASRAHRDAEAKHLDTHLKNQYARWETHFKAVLKSNDEQFQDLGAMATKAGGVIGNNLASAMRAAIPTVDSAASALAATVRRYLKTASPTEAGPMSDLNTWWDHLAPTLVASFDHHSVKKTLTDAVTPSMSRQFGGRGEYGGPHSFELNESVSKELKELVQHLKHEKKQKKDGPIEVHIAGGVGVDAAVYRSRR